MEAVNRHHAIWPRRKQHTPLERAFRNHPGLVVGDADINAHRELHACMQPPPKLSHQLMINIINILDEQPLERPLEGLQVVTNYLETVESGEANRLSRHFNRQMGFLTFQAAELHVEGVRYAK